VPLVYSVSVRGRLVIDPPLAAAGVVDEDADADGDVVLLVDELPLPLHAVAVPSASTASAAVPYLAVRHRRAVVLSLDLTCSYLLTSKSSDNPETDSRRFAGEHVPKPCANRSHHDPPPGVFVRSRLGVAVASGNPAARWRR
jgi:hypothetical protein